MNFGTVLALLTSTVLPTYNVPSNPYTLGQRIELGTKTYRVPRGVRVPQRTMTHICMHGHVSTMVLTYCPRT